ncbi:swarming motility protein YbiA [Gamsiella multidivaricata]|uniref:swarming motility protein YbiA n=1 Tax=Gamsiella multidivaricata TaxID=101098 RepID=UPI00221EEEE0|nr:swarming motility protein YbiA [Gamsiella multidivaricata]KAG0362371.1 hypothetical protein BGZ54_008650 [Gamsiella multidivaricata]KAI7820932.1 swarming motility protein YbiA [Gamsiella multidivaricata]
MKDNINFYRQGDPYGEFSNFYYAPIVLDGQEWPTTEHYFQAQKFAHLPDREYVEIIRVADTPGNAAQMGRNRSWPLRPDWEEVKDDIMRACVLQKFLQHPNLTKVLLDTGEQYLNEHTKNDRYWADGGDGKGKNMLGIVLMEVREKITKMSPEQIEEEVARARRLGAN